jgi:hypothetical protein
MVYDSLINGIGYIRGVCSIVARKVKITLYALLISDSICGILTFNVLISNLIQPICRGFNILASASRKQS